MLVHCSISACLRSCAAARSGTTISGKARDRSAGKPPPIFRAARGGALSGRLDVGARFGGDSAATSAFTICSTSNCEAAAASGAKPIVCGVRLVVSDLPAAGCESADAACETKRFFWLFRNCASPDLPTRAAWPASLPARLAACAASRPPRASRRRAPRCAAARAAARSTRRRRRGRPSRGRPRTARSARRRRFRVRAGAS